MHERRLPAELAEPVPAWPFSPCGVNAPWCTYTSPFWEGSPERQRNGHPSKASHIPMASRVLAQGVYAALGGEKLHLPSLLLVLAEIQEQLWSPWCSGCRISARA